MTEGTFVLLCDNVQCCDPSIIDCGDYGECLRYKKGECNDNEIIQEIESSLIRNFFSDILIQRSI